MGRATYLVLLLACTLATLPLELLIGARVYRNVRRYMLTLAPVVAMFTVWDVWAIAQGHWDFDPEQTSGATLPFDLPLDELLFFVVIPTCALLTFEAVRRLTGWSAGDGEER